MQRGPPHLSHDTASRHRSSLLNVHTSATLQKKNKEIETKKTNITPKEMAAIWSRHTVIDNKKNKKDQKKTDPADKTLARVRHIWFGTRAIPLLRSFFRAPQSQLAQKFGWIFEGLALTPLRICQSRALVPLPAAPAPAPGPLVRQAGVGASTCPSTLGAHRPVRSLVSLEPPYLRTAKASSIHVILHFLKSLRGLAFIL